MVLLWQNKSPAPHACPKIRRICVLGGYNVTQLKVCHHTQIAWIIAYTVNHRFAVCRPPTDWIIVKCKTLFTHCTVTIQNRSEYPTTL